jgi:hypothetical protein
MKHKNWLTDEEVEIEIERLNASEAGITYEMLDAMYRDDEEEN